MRDAEVEGAPQQRAGMGRIGALAEVATANESAGSFRRCGRHAGRALRRNGWQGVQSVVKSCEFFPKSFERAPRRAPKATTSAPS